MMMTVNKKGPGGDDRTSLLDEPEMEGNVLINGSCRKEKLRQSNEERTLWFVNILSKCEC